MEETRTLHTAFRETEMALQPPWPLELGDKDFCPLQSSVCGVLLRQPQGRTTLPEIEVGLNIPMQEPVGLEHRIRAGNWEVGM